MPVILALPLAALRWKAVLSKIPIPGFGGEEAAADEARWAVAEALSHARVHVRITTRAHNNSRAVQREIHDAVGAAIRETAENLVKDAQQRAPVRTGKLRSSIGITELTNRRAVVTVGAEYGRAVNDGRHTRGGGWVPGNPFFDAAVEQARRTFAPTIANAAKRKLG